MSYILIKEMYVLFYYMFVLSCDCSSKLVSENYSLCRLFSPRVFVRHRVRTLVTHTWYVPECTVPECIVPECTVPDCILYIIQCAV